MQKYHFWLKNEGEKWSRKIYSEIPPCGKTAFLGLFPSALAIETLEMVQFNNLTSLYYGKPRNYFIKEIVYKECANLGVVITAGHFFFCN